MEENVALRVLRGVGLGTGLLFGYLLPAAAVDAPQPPEAPGGEPVAEATVAAADPREVIYERVTVLGGVEDVGSIPGSAHVVTHQELEEQMHSDVNRVLQQVPGVNIQEEEGYGLRPNIGIRGTGVERSSKITLMEDGVLIAPAPYTAPSAYYFPTIGRMDSVEVRKGSAAIKQGPYTNGGAINFISTPIPGDFTVGAHFAFGEDQTLRFGARVGDSGQRYGWSLETYQFETDGFKHLDGVGTASDKTGVDLEDYVAKFRVNSDPGARFYQSLELKLGKTEQLGHETYLGLTAADFRDDPFRRYVGSAEDRIDTDHEQIQLLHFVQLRDNLDLTTTVYNNDFYRDWFKNERTAGVSNAAILDNPEAHGRELAILRGEIDSAPGELALRHNRRNYYSRGIQSVLGLQLGRAGGVHHKIEIGVRVHEDEEDRFQEDDLYQMLGGGLQLTHRGAPGSQTNRVSFAEATAFFVQDTIQLGKRWTLVPGVRFESIDYTREDYSTQDPTRSLGPTRVRQNSIEEVIPGLGVSYALSTADRLFLGVHRGFSPPGAGVTEDTEAEVSVNYELGWRREQGALSLEVIAFFNDYSNLLGADTQSGGGGATGELFNGGAVEVRGLEFGARYDLGASRGWSLSVPLRLTYTYTVAEFQTSFDTSFEDWAPRVEVGDEVPYIPEHQLAAGIGVVGQKWGTHLNLSYVGALRTRAGQGPIPEGEGTDRRTILDLSVEREVLSRYKVFAQLRNVTDEIYIVARRPYGVRPGLPRSLMVGVSAKF